MVGFHAAPEKAKVVTRAEGSFEQNRFCVERIWVVRLVGVIGLTKRTTTAAGSGVGAWARLCRKHEIRDRHHRTPDVAFYKCEATLRAGMMASRLNHRGHVIPALTDHLGDKGGVIGPKIHG